MLKNLDHVNIVVSDLEDACSFYVGVLNLRETFRRKLEGAWLDEVTGLAGAIADCVFFDFPEGGARIELLCFHSPEGVPLAHHDVPHGLGVRHVAFLVDDLDHFVSRLKSSGISVYCDPVCVPFPVGETGCEKRLCYFRDPEGVLLEVAEYRERGAGSES